MGGVCNGDVSEQWVAFTGGSAASVAGTVPGWNAPLGSPGRAAAVDRLGLDTVLVADLPEPV
jgi:hypothetical protein